MPASSTGEWKWNTYNEYIRWLAPRLVFRMVVRHHGGFLVKKTLGPALPLLGLMLFFLSSPGLPAQVEGLRSSDPKTREKAAAKLGKQGNSGDIPALAELIKDPVLDVRAEATGAILRIGTRHSLEPLRTATRDSTPQIQIIAVDGLVNFYYPGYIKTGWTAALKSLGGNIKGRFSKPEPKIVDPYLTIDEATTAAIARVITGGTSMESRANAARAAGVLRAKPALSQLMEALRSRDTTVILESVRAIKKIGDPSVGPELTFLLNDLDKDVQYEVVRTMGQLRVTEAVPELENLLRRSRKKRIRRQSLIALAKLPQPSLRVLFSSYLRDKDKQLRAAAAEGLGRLGNRDDLKTILDAFAKEKNESARLSMAFGAASLGDQSFLAYLYDGLNSSFHRLEARPFLTELARDPDVLQQLYRPLASGTAHQKKHLAYVISISGNEQSMSHLEKLTHDRDLEVAQEAVRALKNLQARL